MQGAGILASHGKAAEGGDLGDMLLKTFAAAGVALTRARVDALAAIADTFPAATAAQGKVNFLRAALRWAGAAAKAAPAAGAGGAGEAEEESGAALLARLHLLTARACVAGGDEFAADAQRHYLECGAGAEFGSFLFGWATAGGYAGEEDLFLARAVLQLLCLGNLRDANAVRDEFVRLAAEKGVAVDTPLSHFTRFLLLTLEVRRRRHRKARERGAAQLTQAPRFPSPSRPPRSPSSSRSATRGSCSRCSCPSTRRRSTATTRSQTTCRRSACASTTSSRRPTVWPTSCPA